jgi:hypothetical protein
MRIRLSAQALEQRIARLEAALQGDGEVTRPVPDREPPDGTWYVDIRVAAPGYGLPRPPHTGTRSGGSRITARGS